MRCMAALLRRERGMIAAFITSVATVFAVSFAFGAPMAVARLTAEVEGFLLVLYLILAAVRTRRQVRWQMKAEALEQALRDEQRHNAHSRDELNTYFLTWMHQIKTPITVSNLLLEHRDDGDADILREQLRYIEEYTGMALSYLKLVDHDTDMDIAPITLDKVICPILKKNSRLFISRGITLIYETIPNRVITDGRWFSVLLEQLISNALKYTSKGSIRISYDEKACRLSVSDTGIGIRSEDLPKIFDRGYSGLNGRINDKSSGIGLYLAKRIADRLNLTLDVQSVLGEGSQFNIIFEPNLTML